MALVCTLYHQCSFFLLHFYGVAAVAELGNRYGASAQNDFWSAWTPKDPTEWIFGPHARLVPFIELGAECDDFILG